MHRRRILQGLFAGVGFQVAQPGSARGDASHAVQGAEAASQAADWRPAFLDEHDLATLKALCSRIVPGSERSGSDRFIDRLLEQADHERQSQFLGSLGAIDARARERFGGPFKILTLAQQDELLAEAAAGTPGQPEWVWTPGTPVVPPEEPSEVVVTLRDHFDRLKARIVDAHYSSEAGLKELGYTGQTFFQAFPGCTHDEHL